MSLNFNFSGLFGGTPSLDRSKFDFSAYAPQTEQPTQTATAPEPEVRYSNTVQDLLSTATPSNSETAMTSLENNLTQPIDMGMNFGVAPITPVVPTNDILNSTATGFDVNSGAVEELLSREDKRQQLISPLFENIEGFGLGDVKRDDFISEEQKESILGFVEGDDFNSLLGQYSDAMTQAFGDDRTGFYKDNRAVISELGLPTSFKVKGDFGGMKQYEFNTETGEYDVIQDNTVSKDAAMAETIIKAAPVVMITAGVGSALANSSTIMGVAGGNTAIASGLGQGIASGISTGIQGGDAGDVLTSAVLGGLGGYADGLDTLTADGGFMSGLSVTEAAELTSHAELIGQISNGVDLVKAVEAGDVVGAINAGLSLAGSSNLNDVVTDNILSNTDSDFVRNNVDAISSGAIGAGEAIIKGGDVVEVVQSVANNIVKDTYLTEENVGSLLNEYAGDNSFVANNLEPLVKGVIKGGETALDGGNRKDIFVDTVKPIVKEIIKDTYDSIEIGGGDLDIDLKAVEDFWQDNIEKPMEQLWQDIEPQREAVETVVQSGVDYVKDKVVEPVVETVKTIVKEADQVVRALPTTKEDWEDAEQDIKDVASDTASVVREVGRDVREFADPLANDVRQVGRDIRNIDLPDISTPSFNLPSFDLPSFSLPSGGGCSIGDADLVNITLSDPELVKGFDYATLNNPLTNKRVI